MIQKTTASSICYKVFIKKKKLSSKHLTQQQGARDSKRNALNVKPLSLPLHMPYQILYYRTVFLSYDHRSLPKFHYLEDSSSFSDEQIINGYLLKG